MLTQLTALALALALPIDAAYAQSGVVQVEAADAAMEAAKRVGRATLPQFDRALGAGEGDEHAVKFDLDGGPDAEFIWATVIARTPAGYRVRLANEPLLAGFRLNQEVEARRGDVIDWAYQLNSVMRGHHSTRVLLDRVPAEQAAAIRQSFGW